MSEKPPPRLFNTTEGVGVFISLLVAESSLFMEMVGSYFTAASALTKVDCFAAMAKELFS